MTRLSDERMCRGREFQILGEDTQKAREVKDDYTAALCTASQCLPSDCRPQVEQKARKRLLSFRSTG